MESGNETVWRIVFGVLGSFVTGLLFLMRAVIVRLNGNGNGNGARQMRRDLDRIEAAVGRLTEKVDHLIRQEELRQTLTREPR